ncbi:MAG: hypothetical protein AAGA93_05580 [Actinomycetota bacterium]
MSATGRPRSLPVTDLRVTEGFLDRDGQPTDPALLAAFVDDVAQTAPAYAAELAGLGSPTGATGHLSGAMLERLRDRIADYFAGRIPELVEVQSGWLRVGSHVAQCPPGAGNRLAFSVSESDSTSRELGVQILGFGGGPSVSFSLEVTDEFTLDPGRAARIGYDVRCTWERWRIDRGDRVDTFVRLGSVDGSVEASPLTPADPAERQAWGDPVEQRWIVKPPDITRLRTFEVKRSRLTRGTIGASAFGQALTVTVLSERRFTTTLAYTLANGTTYLAERFDSPPTWWVRPAEPGEVPPGT